VIQRARKLKKRDGYNALAQEESNNNDDEEGGIEGNKKGNKKKTNNNNNGDVDDESKWRSLMLKTKKSTHWYITVLSVLSFVGLIVGVTMPFLHLEYHFNLDIKKWIIDSNIHSEIIQTYSIISACYVMAVPNHIGGENKGMSFLTLSFVVIAPLMRSFLGIILWFVPLHPRIQRYLAGTIDYLSVVSGAEVFGVTSFVMIYELPLMFKHMEEAAKYMQLDLSSLMALKIFTLSGFVDTFVSHAIHKHYLAAAGFEE
jgi:hypothetical protein